MQNAQRHSTILPTFIKLPFFIKTVVLSILSGRFRQVFTVCSFFSFQFTTIFPETASWHGFDNTDYHCWDLTASASNTVPITCDGESVIRITNKKKSNLAPVYNPLYTGDS